MRGAEPGASRNRMMHALPPTDSVAPRGKAAMTAETTRCLLTFRPSGRQETAAGPQRGERDA